MAWTVDISGRHKIELACRYPSKDRQGPRLFGVLSVSEGQVSVCERVDKSRGGGGG